MKINGFAKLGKFGFYFAWYNSYKKKIIINP